MHQSPQSNRIRSSTDMDVRLVSPVIIVCKTKMPRNSNSNTVCFPITTYVVVATNTIMQFQVSRRFRIVVSLRTWAIQLIKWTMGPNTVQRRLIHTRKMIVNKRRSVTYMEINHPSYNKNITCEWNKRIQMRITKATNSTVESMGSDLSKETTRIK